MDGSIIEVCFVDDKDNYTLYISDRMDVAGVITRAVISHNKM